MVATLNPMPIATPNFAVPEASKLEDVFRAAVPLDLTLCTSCGLLQVPEVGNRDLQYSNYVYTTSLSLGLDRHFRRYADEVLNRLKPNSSSFIVEIGSNDGTLLRQFRDAGMRVLGIDPAREIARRARKAGIDTIAAFFTEDLACNIRQDYGSADIIIANNVLANIDDLPEIMRGVRHLLKPDGVFVFETQYGADVIEKNLLDTVYHEHLSYFNIKPLDIGLSVCDLQLFTVERVPTKGGSIRAFAQHKGGPRPVDPIVEEMIAAEERSGHYDPERYKKWSAEIAEIRKELAVIIEQERRQGGKIGGYGVSVGTSTLLAQFELAGKIDFLFDDDKQKATELVGPGYILPVHGTDGVYEYNPTVIFIFAWRYSEAIIAKHSNYLQRGGKFVVPLPKVQIIAKQ